MAKAKGYRSYASRTSIKAGEKNDVHVSTYPVSRYAAPSTGMGSHGGAGARLMRELGPFQGTAEPTPKDGDRGLVECNWKVGFDLEIPRDWVSGVYLGKLSTLPALGGQYLDREMAAESYFVFIVRDDRPADLLFQCSDLTWQAYNRWPAWRSLYDWKGNKWHTAVGADVSFDRPYSVYYNGLPSGFNPLTNGSGEFLLWEHPLGFWLEQEGYDVTYISNLDTHADGDGPAAGRRVPLGRPRRVLDAGDVRQRAAGPRRRGGAWRSSPATRSTTGSTCARAATAGRIGCVFGRVDQFDDEQELIGATSYGVGMGDWICARPDHWLFEGTGMKEGDRIPQLVGWEYHGFPVKEGADLVVLAAPARRTQTRRPAVRRHGLHGGPGEPRLQRRDLLVEHAPARRRVPEPAETRTSAAPTPASSGSRRTCSTGSSSYRSTGEAGRKAKMARMKLAAVGVAVLLGVSLSARAERLIYHEIRTDEGGKIIPWSGPPSQAYDHVVRLVWKFWNGMEKCENGVPYYMQHMIWYPNRHSNGLGGDQIPMALSSWNLLYGYLGDEAVKQNMVYMADYWLDHGLSKPTDAWANIVFPYDTVRHSGVYDGDMVAGKGVLQPDKAASFASELVVLYKMTGNRRYLDAAVKMADMLVKHVRPGDTDHSPWPYRVAATTGQTAQAKMTVEYFEAPNPGEVDMKRNHNIGASYTTNWTGALRLIRWTGGPEGG